MPFIFSVKLINSFVLCWYIVPVSSSITAGTAHLASILNESGAPYDRHDMISRAIHHQPTFDHYIFHNLIPTLIGVRCAKKKCQYQKRQATFGDFRGRHGNRTGSASGDATKHKHHITDTENASFAHCLSVTSHLTQRLLDNPQMDDGKICNKIDTKNFYI